MLLDILHHYSGLISHSLDHPFILGDEIVCKVKEQGHLRTSWANASILWVSIATRKVIQFFNPLLINHIKLLFFKSFFVENCYL